MSELTTDELAKHIQSVSQSTELPVSDLVQHENTVVYKMGVRQFLALRSLAVLEITESKYGSTVYSSTPHSRHQEDLLKGGNR